MLQTNEFKVLLGIKLRTRRVELGLTQKAVAIKCNISAALIGSIERGEGNPSFLKLFAICTALEITPSKLLEGIE